MCLEFRFNKGIAKVFQKIQLLDLFKKGRSSTSNFYVKKYLYKKFVCLQSSFKNRQRYTCQSMYIRYMYKMLALTSFLSFD